MIFFSSFFFYFLNFRSKVWYGVDQTRPFYCLLPLLSSAPPTLSTVLSSSLSHHFPIIPPPGDWCYLSPFFLQVSVTVRSFSVFNPNPVSKDSLTAPLVSIIIEDKRRRPRWPDRNYLLKYPEAGYSFALSTSVTLFFLSLFCYLLNLLVSFCETASMWICSYLIVSFVHRSCCWLRYPSYHIVQELFFFFASLFFVQ